MTVPRRWTLGGVWNSLMRYLYLCIRFDWFLNLRQWTVLKGFFTPKWKSCQHLLTLLLLQMYDFLPSVKHKQMSSRMPECSFLLSENCVELFSDLITTLYLMTAMHPMWHWVTFQSDRIQLAVRRESNLRDKILTKIWIKLNIRSFRIWVLDHYCLMGKKKVIQVWRMSKWWLNWFFECTIFFIWVSVLV